MAAFGSHFGAAFQADLEAIFSKVWIGKQRIMNF